MTQLQFPENCLSPESGDEMHALMRELYPICRSITGNGVRQTLRIVNREIPLEIHEIPSGQEVFDWTVPQEWNIEDAYVINPDGKKIIDFKKLNLHVLNYSIPVKKKVGLEELKAHLFTVPDHPDLIPYRTSYYNENWGFCLSHSQYETLVEGTYEVRIDSSLKDGHLTYGECTIKGKSSDEILISTHICHPSLCNDNLSGIVIATMLAKSVARADPEYSYRFLFIPGTIGSITWLAQNEERLASIKHGIVITCAGDAGKFTYKRSRRGNAAIDRIVCHALRETNRVHDSIDFFPYGYDERQYCSPGFDLPVGCIMRTPHGQFPEYHTSGDNLNYVRPKDLADSASLCLSVFGLIENNKVYVNQNPKCEPQLGKRGLYKAIGGQADSQNLQLAMLWVLNLTDGRHSLLDIAELAGMPFERVHAAAALLLEKGLLKEKARKDI